MSDTQIIGIIETGLSIEATITAVGEAGRDAETSRWVNKRYLSIGDGATWYNGHILAGSVDVVCVGYQQQLINKFAVILTNVGAVGQTMGKPSGWAGSFMDELTTIDYTLFDLITIALGANDLHEGGGSPLGSLGVISDNSFDQTTFYGAYRKAIEHILTVNPNVKLVLMTPTKSNLSEPSILSLSSKAYSDAITNLGALYGLSVCDLYKNSGFNKLTNTTYTIDGLNPSNAGHFEVGKHLTGDVTKI